MCKADSQKSILTKFLTRSFTNFAMTQAKFYSQCFHNSHMISVHSFVFPGYRCMWRITFASLFLFHTEGKHFCPYSNNLSFRPLNLSLEAWLHIQGRSGVEMNEYCLLGACWRQLNLHLQTGTSSQRITLLESRPGGFRSKRIGYEGLLWATNQQCS